MAILKNKTQNNYMSVSRQVTRDKNLSLTDRGLLITLLSLPDGWNLSNRGLQAILPDGRDRIAKAMNRLIELGYVTREQKRIGNRYGCNQIEVHDMPQETGESQKTAFQATENQFTETPCTETPQQLTKNNNTKHNHTRVKECSKTDSLTDPEYEDLVKEFGRAEVDYQLKRISENHYQGCRNYKTVRQWCEERRSRTQIKAPGRRNAFSEFEQNTDIDYEELEKKIICNI